MFFASRAYPAVSTWGRAIQWPSLKKPLGPGETRLCLFFPKAITLPLQISFPISAPWKLLFERASTVSQGKRKIQLTLPPHPLQHTRHPKKTTMHLSRRTPALMALVRERAENGAFRIMSKELHWFSPRLTAPTSVPSGRPAAAHIVGRRSIEGADAERGELVQMIQMDVPEQMIQRAEPALLAQVERRPPQQLPQVRRSWERAPRGERSRRAASRDSGAGIINQAPWQPPNARSPATPPAPRLPRPPPPPPISKPHHHSVVVTQQATATPNSPAWSAVNFVRPAEYSVYLAGPLLPWAKRKEG